MKKLKEDARKFYVDIARAKKSLCISYTDVNSNGYFTGLTPFMNSIKGYFYSGENLNCYIPKH